RDVGSVAVAVTAVAVEPWGRPGGGGAAAEVLVGDVQSGVADVRVDPLAGRLVRVALGQLPGALVDAVEAPGQRRALGAVDGDDLVLFDGGDAGVPAQLGELVAVEPSGEPVQDAVEPPDAG